MGKVESSFAKGTALQQCIRVRGNRTRVLIAGVRRHQRHHILERRRGFGKETVDHLTELLRIGWIERSRYRHWPDLLRLPAASGSSLDQKETGKQRQRDDTDRQSFHMRAPSQIPGMTCWQNRHLPASRWMARTVKPARSTTTRRHFGHQVLSAGWPGTLPMYT